MATTKNEFKPFPTDQKEKWNKEAADELESFLTGCEDMTPFELAETLKQGFKALYVLKEQEKFKQRERDKEAVAAITVEIEAIKTDRDNWKKTAEKHQLNR